MADCENIISGLSEFIEYIEYNLVIYIPQVENGLIQLYKKRLKENLSANIQFEHSICISWRKLTWWISLTDDYGFHQMSLIRYTVLKSRSSQNKISLFMLNK